MMRFTTFLLCVILAAAAAGRYKAEIAVRETKSEARALDRQKAEELSSIQVLRAEVAYLERPERLAEIAQTHTGLAPLNGAQLMTAEDLELAFAAARGGTEAAAQPIRPAAKVTVAGLE
jgi:cell division protein FtsL